MLIIKANPTYKETSIDEEWKNYKTQEYWDYRKQWEEIPKALKLLPFPIHLDLETTSYCNLLCVMCPRTIMREKKIDYQDNETVEMSMELFKKIVDEGKKEGLKSIKFQYLGEPLADSLIIQRIKYAKQKGILDTMFNTNATLLTEKKAWEILRAGIDNVFFSVDSIIPEKYEKIRVNANYEKVVINIKRFMKIKKEFFPQVHTRISHVVFPGTPQKELDDFKEFWLPIVGTVGFDKWVDYDGINGGENQPNFVCAQPYQRMFVRYDANCVPCCFDSLKEYKLGNANEKTIKEIWLGPLFQKMRDIHKAGKYYEIDICKKCIMPHS